MRRAAERARRPSIPDQEHTTPCARTEVTPLPTRPPRRPRPSIWCGTRRWPAAGAPGRSRPSRRRPDGAPWSLGCPCSHQPDSRSTRRSPAPPPGTRSPPLAVSPGGPGCPRRGCCGRRSFEASSAPGEGKGKRAAQMPRQRTWHPRRTQEPRTARQVAHAQPTPTRR